jgi:hypothetical protein
LFVSFGAISNDLAHLAVPVMQAMQAMRIHTHNASLGHTQAHTLFMQTLAARSRQDVVAVCRRAPHIPFLTSHPE